MKKKIYSRLDDILLTDEEYADAYLDGVKGLNEKGSIERVRSGQNLQKKRQIIKTMNFIEKEIIMKTEDGAYPVIDKQKWDEVKILLEN